MEQEIVACPKCEKEFKIDKCGGELCPTWEQLDETIGHECLNQLVNKGGK